MSKNRPISTICFLSLSLFLAVIRVQAGDNAPGWLEQAAALKAPSYDKNVTAVVLVNQSNVTLDESGRLVTTEQYAMRVLTRDGRKQAVAVESYLSNFSNVRDMQAWLISPSGKVTSYGKKDIIDRVASPNDVYDEVRLKIIDGSLGADVGYVFGYSLTKEDRPLFYQDKWLFQDDLPTLDSRYTLTIPNDWKVTSMTFNHAEVSAQKNGNSYIWELRDLPPIKWEPMSPSFANLVPRLAVNILPSDTSQAVNRSFSDWTAVSRWASGMYDPQVVVDDNLAAKTRDLTAGAKSEMDIIRAIGHYVQNMQYIALDIGMGYGNGMRPRPSNEVLARGYADCKNKANLMRAMLKVMKIESYPVAIYSGDPNFVRKEFPSPEQFNHCIIAIRVSNSTDAPTVIKDEKLGRLLIFDATDPFTSVGDLPDYLQGSYAVIVAGENGGLVKMPLTPPETALLDRKITVDLKDTGEISGKIFEHASGQMSSSYRRENRDLSPSEYKKVIEGWLTRGATGAQVIGLTPKDKASESVFDLDVDFRAPMYAQLMQNKLLVFKPVIVGRRFGVYLTESTRANPIEIDSQAMKESVEFNLPAGFGVDETPDAVNLDTPFGKYSTTYEIKGSKLVFTRSLVMNRTLVAAENYASVKDFFTKIRAAEQSPVVLVKK